MPTHIVAAACRESTKRKKKGRPTLGQPLGQAIQCFRVALAVRGLLLHLPWVFWRKQHKILLNILGQQ